MYWFPHLDGLFQLFFSFPPLPFIFFQNHLIFIQNISIFYKESSFLIPFLVLQQISTIFLYYHSNIDTSYPFLFVKLLIQMHELTEWMEYLISFSTVGLCVFFFSAKLLFVACPLFGSLSIAKRPP